MNIKIYLMKLKESIPRPNKKHIYSLHGEGGAQTIMKLCIPQGKEQTRTKECHNSKTEKEVGSGQNETRFCVSTKRKTQLNMKDILS
jgi:hypothetical protein